MKKLLSLSACLYAFIIPPLSAESIALPSSELRAQREQFASFPHAPQFRKRAQEMMLKMERDISSLSANINEIAAQLPQLDTPPAEELVVKKGESVIDCSVGLYFDPLSSLLTYIGNVRLRDAHFELDCERLFLKLKKKEVAEESVKVSEEAQGIAAEDGNAQDTKADGADGAAQDKSAQVEAAVPYKMVADEVLLDLQRDRVYARGKHVVFSRNGTQMEIEGGSPRLLVWDSAGIIYLQGDYIRGSYQNERGEETQFSTQGSAMFLLDENSLVLEKSNKLQTPQYCLSSKGMIRMELIPTKIAAGQEASLAAFPALQRRFEGLGRISMMDSVCISGKSASSGEVFEMQGDLLSYDARNGEALLTGDHVSLVQGDQNMQLRDKAMLALMPDGAINISAQSIDGQYVRFVLPEQAALASQQEGNKTQRLLGTFKTSGKISFAQEDAAIHFSNGLVLSDDLLDFSAQGKLLLHMAKDNAKSGAILGDAQMASSKKVQDKPQSGEKQGAWMKLPNMKMAEYRQLQSFHSIGATKIVNRGESPFSLQGDDVYIDYLYGKAKVQALAGHWAELHYREQQFKAFSREAVSSMEVFDNGDIKIFADDIEIQIPSENQGGLTHVSCANALELFRARGELLFAKDIRLNNATMKFASKGPLSAYLRPDSNAQSISRAYPHLNYNFSALDAIKTSAGVTLQSSDYSMQCDGDFIINMDEQEPASASAMSGLKTANATGNVKFALRSNRGDIYRAEGDELFVDGQTGEKILSGQRVILQDKSSTHLASGPDAYIRVDNDNNISFHGKSQLSITKQLDDKTSSASKATKSSKPKKDKIPAGR